MNYFGGVIQLSFSLEVAIKSGILTGYYYFPQTVKLIAKKQSKWNALTETIDKIIAAQGNESISISYMLAKNPKLKLKVIERSRIIKKAVGKISLALDVIKNNFSLGNAG